MIVSHLLLILPKKIQLYIFMFEPEMWQKVAKFKGAEYFRKALYVTSAGSHAAALDNSIHPFMMNI